MRSDVLRITEAIWIENGMKRSISAALTECETGSLELKIEFKDGLKFISTLSSTDGFNYTCGETSEQNHYALLDLKFFRQDQFRLLCGNWKSTSSGGELCIHARNNVTFFPDPSSERGRVPPAA